MIRANRRRLWWSLGALILGLAGISWAVVQQRQISAEIINVRPTSTSSTRGQITHSGAGLTFTDFTGTPLLRFMSPTFFDPVIGEAFIDAAIARDAEIASGYQPLDADLTTIAALSSTGLAVRTGSGTWAQRSVAVTSSTGLSVSNGDGVSGNPTVAGIDASTTVKGVASFNSTNFSASGGAINTIQNIAPGSSPTFAAATLGTLYLKDTAADHTLYIVESENLTANRGLSISVGNADRTLTLSGNATLADWFSQSVKDTASPVFVGITSTSTADSNLYRKEILANESTGTSAVAGKVWRVGGADIGGVYAHGANHSSFANAFVFRGFTSGPMHFGVDNSTDMSILTGGNVTIGSTTATSMFNVGTSAQFQVGSTGNVSASDITFNNKLIVSGEADTFIQAASADYMHVSVGGGSFLTMEELPESSYDTLQLMTVAKARELTALGSTAKSVSFVKGTGSVVAISGEPQLFADTSIINPPNVVLWTMDSDGNSWVVGVEPAIEEQTDSDLSLPTHRAEDILPVMFTAKNAFLGKSVSYDIATLARNMEILIRELSRQNAGVRRLNLASQYVFENSLPSLENRDWSAEEEAASERKEAEAALRLMAIDEIEVLESDIASFIVEIPETMDETTTATVQRWRFDEETGKRESVEEIVSETVSTPTGRTRKELSDTIRLDPETGKYFRRLTFGEALAKIEPVAQRAIPDWLAAQLQAVGAPTVTRPAPEPTPVPTPMPYRRHKERD